MGAVSSISSLSFRSAWRATPASLAERLSGRAWQRRPHLERISNIIAEAAFTGNRRIIISVPPRHGKSELISKWAPIWFLDRFPERRIILASYGAALAGRWGKRVRDIANREAGELRFALQKGSQAAGAWETSRGGGMTTAGVGGAITGLGADLMIIDDPVKNWQEAYSPTRRETIWDWWESTAGTRIEPNGSVILLMTRWHHDDLAGRLLRQSREDPDAEQWEEIVIPAIAEDEDDPLGREPGEALWPERYDVEKLAQIEKRVGPIVWAALYQQRPRPKSGGLFKADNWRFYRPGDLPKFEFIGSSWDCTFKDLKSSDFVVGGPWGFKGAEAFLLDLERGRWDITATIAAMRRQREKLAARQLKVNAWWVEDKANGPAVISMLKREIPGLIGVEPDGTKEARAAAISPFQHAGNLYLPLGLPWVQAFVAEHEDFPGGENDDQVDMTSQAISQKWLTSYSPPPTAPMRSTRSNPFSMK